MQHILIDGIKYDLPALEKDCWNRLVNGAVQGRNPMHNAVVANMGPAGINMRTVVLRKAWPTEKRLSFYTDIRSGKWAEIEQYNPVSWLLYDAGARIQIRASGLASLHQTDELADQAWSGNNILNRKNYLSVLIPSAASSNPVSGLSQEIESDEISLEQTEEGRKNFGVISTQIKWMEWLWLNDNGHRRASFVYDEPGGFSANWLVP
jgi:pyridoxamine 5'-phosphate oxidase